jgi:DNA recombination protein RmuC
VKTEFEKFGGVMEKVHRKLAEASSVVAQAQSRTRAVERKLRDVERLPEADAELLLGAPGAGPEAEA